mmetsp:Transcript_5503/g.13790  ORF Transcript_5503/g.13790 Transcript_5503/m.13790 type:complete len:730 (-) Transcript_5503:1325-3514(-)|eukprot:CAMPEP_0197197458 /NCGR_PEP_ID=MMETSP1423-20130617/32875_1 /TAXON_ID=476441 /ORGANISM="Pseudo-nitzschia heimii, Strain UNC1101" /LENGTH=729 /DNA_ID=CAMNT_0042651279 /DNA_START=573 /DNA_END=2762 /DNA_ORIENTATION=-
MSYNSKKKTIVKGDHVSLVGLKTSDLNGKTGIIVTLSKSSKKGRYGVLIDGAEKPLAIKPANILVTPDESSTSERKNACKFDLRLLKKGDRVTLVDLKTAVFNGKRGVVVSLSDPSNEGRFGILVDGEQNPMGVKPANMKPLAKSTLELRKERDEMHALQSTTDDEHLGANKLSFMRTMISAFMTEEHEIKLFGRKIEPMPDFRLELIKKGGGFPKGVNPKWANDYLREAYEEHCGLPHMLEAAFKSPDYEPRRQDLVKRLRCLDRDRLEWYFTAQPGDIYENRVVTSHARCIRYSYSNQAYKNEVLTQGKTHVAIGFVDLGFLMASHIKGGGYAPLKFVGIDSCPYIIAKTLLIWQLVMHAGSMACVRERESFQNHIAQVWFSTTWSQGTESAVRECLSSLLSSSEEKFDAEVRSILEHWHEAPSISLTNAREQLRALNSTSCTMSIGMMKRQRDRIALSKYALTGDFCVSDPVCGNIILLDCPDGTPPPERNESVFSALDFQAIMQLANSHPCSTIVDIAEMHALSGIEKLVGWSGANRVSVELRCSRVEDVIDDIAAMKPWTMSWSNVLDYMGHREFHQMARRCSKHGNTLHFGYSMNWSTDVWGTCLIDYGGSANANYRATLLENANPTLRSMFCQFGWEEYFRFPLPENPINTVAKMLECLQYKKWTEYFFSYARQGGLHCEVGTIDYWKLSPLSNTGESTVSFTWTYDREVNLRGVAAPLIPF